MRTFKTEKLNNLEVTLKNAQVTFTSWGRKEVKVEIELTELNKSKAGGTQEVRLEDVVMMDYREDNLIIKDQIKPKYSSLSKITIYSPCDLKKLSVQIENGNFSSNGDLITASKIKINKGNINLARYKGSIDAEVLKGNIIVGSGKLNGTSIMHSENGNISAKTELLSQDNYKFEVNIGNIELSLPGKTAGDFSCQGNVLSNPFISSGNGPKLIISSKQGSINVKKY